MPENTSIPVPAPVGPTAPFPLHAVPRFTQCPPPPPDLAEPGPGNLAYGLTLPSAVATPDIVQEAAEIILGAHRVEEELIDPVLFLLRELAVYACRFTGSGEYIHLALRRAEGALQVTVHDTHAAHTHPRLAAACDGRRRAALLRVPDLVEAHHGTWGFGSAHQPGTGTCTWATLARVP